MLASVKSLLSNHRNESSKRMPLAGTIEDFPKKLVPKKKKLPLFDPNLVNDLEDDHQGIMLQYQDVLQYAKERNFVELSKHFENFSSKLIIHIRKEDEQLYLYIKSLACCNGSIEEKVCGEFIAGMKKITISIFYTLSQSPYIPVNNDNVEAFIGEFKALGNDLQDRMNREEKIIFPMYENSRTLVDIS